MAMYVSIPLCCHNGVGKEEHERMLFGDSGLPRWLAEAGIPELLEQEMLETRLGPRAAAKFEPLIRNALSYWRTQIPVAAGETLSSEKMACLAKPWGGLDTGTLVYLRDTNKARTAFVLPGAKIDTLKGKLSASPEAVWNLEPFAALRPRTSDASPALRFEAMAAQAMARGSDEATFKTLVDSALTAVTFVGFGITGPWGLSLAGAAAVAETLFNSFFAAGTPPDQRIGEIVKNLLGKQEITDRGNVIQTSLAVFKENWTEMKTMDTQQLATLRDVAARQVQDTSDLNQALNFLSGNVAVNFMDTETMKRQVVLLYGLGVSTKLLWIKLAALLDESPECKADRSKSGYLHTLVMVGDNALAHVAHIENAIATEISARIANVKECISGSYRVFEEGRFGPRTVECCSFQDLGDPWSADNLGRADHFNEMVTHHGGCCGNQVQWDTCKQKRATYIDKLQKQILDRYSYDFDYIAKLRAGLAKAVNAYRPYLKS
jgi:hypothetical protein